MCKFQIFPRSIHGEINQKKKRKHRFSELSEKERRFKSFLLNINEHF